jgi:hypothetical protein
MILNTSRHSCLLIFPGKAVSWDVGFLNIFITPADRKWKPSSSFFSLSSTISRRSISRFSPLVLQAINRGIYYSFAQKKKMAFSALGLSAPLLKAIGEQSFTQPTPVQQQAIPAILQGKDILGMLMTMGNCWISIPREARSDATSTRSLPALKRCSVSKVPQDYRRLLWIRGINLWGNHSRLVKFEEYLRNKKFSGNYIHNIWKNLKAIFNAARKRKVITCYPLDK